MTEGNRPLVEEQIRARMESYVDAMISLDVDRIADFYVDHPDFRVYSDGQVMNRAELVDLVAKMGDSLQSFDATWRNVEVTPLGKGAALAAAHFTRSLTDKSGTTIPDWGTVTWVWVHGGGEWRLIHGQAVHYPGAPPEA